MDRKKITEANRLAWNEVTPIHQKARKVDLAEEFAKKGYSTLDETITTKLKALSIEGKDVAQLCCNNGRETLSMLNLGARSGVGFDISDEAVKEARELAKISGLNCEFVRTDVYEIGHEYDNAFDLIYISVGALAWLPDLEAFFTAASRILKAGGVLIIYEHHPFLYVFAVDEEDGLDPDNPTKVIHSYFKKEPWVNDTGIDYLGKSKYKSNVNYNFTQKVSDIVNAVIKSRIEVTEFREFAHDISTEFAHLEKEHKLPLSYILVGRKRAN